LGVGKEALICGTSAFKGSGITPDSTGSVATSGSRSGSGRAIIVGFVRTFSADVFSSFGLRDGTTVLVKWSGKLYDSLGIRDIALRVGDNV
jgi:hypothetical protein